MAESTNPNLVGERAIGVGESKTIRLKVKDKSGNAVAVAGSKVFMMVRENIDDDDTVISKANTAGGGDNTQIELEVDGANSIDIKLGPTDTTRTPGIHCWDCLIELSSGKRGFIVKPQSRMEFENAAVRGV